MRRSIVLLLAAALAAPHVCAQNLSFVTCPIVRDTKAAPCWLAEYKGETYYLGNARRRGAGFLSSATQS